MQGNPTSEPIGPVLVPNEPEGRVPFLEHLEELRLRLLRSLLWVTLAGLVSFRFSHRILDWFIRPVGHVVFMSPTEPFMIHLKVAFFGGILLASPLLAWEVWGFLGPALAPRERRTVFSLVPFSAGLFLFGAWFGWRVLLPVGLRFLMSFGSETLVPMITVGSYVGFAGWLVAACGLVFQMPIVMLFLASLGLVRPATLLRQWRVALIAILIFAAVLTPTPDIFNQLLLAVPMAVLYLVSIGLTFLVTK